MERLRETLKTASITGGNMTSSSPTQFRVEGIPPDAGRGLPRQAATEVEVNFDRSPGAGGTYTFTMKPNMQVTLREEAVVQARQTIERRVNELGVDRAEHRAAGRERRPDPRAASRRDRREPREGDHPVDRACWS